MNRSEMQHLVEPYCSLIFERHTIRYRRNFYSKRCGRLGLMGLLSRWYDIYTPTPRARFIVNGILSDPAPVRTGIRQGCPLAPFLFLLIAEILAIALLQTPTVQGLRHPRFPVMSRNSLLLLMTQLSVSSTCRSTPLCHGNCPPVR